MAQLAFPVQSSNLTTEGTEHAENCDSEKRAEHLQSLGFLQSLGAHSAFIAIYRRNCSNRPVELDRQNRTAARVDDARGPSEISPLALR